MVYPADNSQQYISCYDTSPPRSREPSGISASIWAPQPQPSGITWPKALDSFSRVVERESEMQNHPDNRNATNMPIVSREDVFGRHIGAIGDGRKKNSPDYDDNSVCFFFSPASVSFSHSLLIAR